MYPQWLTSASGHWAGLEVARNHVLKFVFKNSEFGFSFYFVSAVYEYISTRIVTLIPMYPLSVGGWFVTAVLILPGISTSLFVYLS